MGDVTSDSTLSVNGRARSLVEAMRREAAALNVRVSKGALGETLIDAGAIGRGGVAAGLRIAEICMGGLGQASLRPDGATPRWPWTVAVMSSQPVIACLGSQYAGWNLSHGKGPGAFFALGSGPARALAQKEKVFEDIGYRDASDTATLVIESDRPPPPEIVEKVAGDCRVATSAVTVIYAPTQSLAGGAQVVARVLEVALHKAHELGFPVARIVEGMGAAPLSPPHPDFVTAMGRTNDAIIYGGRVQLFVTGPEADAQIAGARPAERHVTGFRRSLRGDLQAVQGRLLRDRSDALQPGRNRRHRGRNRRELPRREIASGSPRCVVRLTRARRTGGDRSSRWSATSATGTRARWRPRSSRKGRRFARIDLAACGFDTTRESGIALQGMGSRLPDAVHVRTLSSGSFEAITKRLGVLHALSAARRRRLERRAGDRALRRQVDDELQAGARPGCRRLRHGRSSRPTRRAHCVTRQARSGPLVLKPLFGSQGRGLRLVRHPTTCRGRTRSPGSTTCSALRRSKAKAFATIVCSSSRAA